MSIHKHEKPSVATDLVLFKVFWEESESKRKVKTAKLKVLLVERKNKPFKGLLALPGGFMNIEEGLINNIKRKTKEKGDVEGDFYIEQLFTVDNVERDERGRVISVSYLGLCNEETVNENGNWFLVEDVLEDRLSIAFDHKEIIAKGFNRIKNKIEYTDIAFNLLPSEFTINQLKSVYEIFIGHEILNFRRKISPYVESLNKKTSGKQFRPAELYTLKKKRKGIF